MHLKMKFIDYEVKKAFDRLTEAICRARADAKADSSDERMLKDWEDICLQSRALYARYVDAALWRGAVDDSTYEHLLHILNDAVECLPPTIKDEKGKERSFEVRDSVLSRLEDFKKFSVGLRDTPRAPVITHGS